MLTDQPEKPRSAVFGMRSYTGSRVSFLLTAEALFKGAPGVKLAGDSTIEIYAPEGPTPGYMAASILIQSRLSVQALVALGQSVEERVADPKNPKARSCLRVDLMWVEGVELKAQGLELPNPELLTRSWAIGTFIRAAEEAIPTKAESKRLLKALQDVPGPHEIGGLPLLLPELRVDHSDEPRPGSDRWTVEGSDWPDGLAAAAYLVGAIEQAKEHPDRFWDPADAARNAANALAWEGQVRLEVTAGPDASASEITGRWLEGVADALRASRMRIATAVVFEAEAGRVRGAVVGERLREPLEYPRPVAVTADRDPADSREWARLHGFPNRTRVALVISRPPP